MPAHKDYAVAWICALPLEMAAAKAMFDENHDRLPQSANDSNTYAFGQISGHNVVITCLSKGVYGATAAATVVSQMRSTFAAIRFGLMVGIGGGVPCGDHDIRLGDIVVGKPTNNSGGVLQYDHGKLLSGGRFQHVGMLNQPPQVLLTAIGHLESNSMIKKGRNISDIVSSVLSNNVDMKQKFSRPALQHDLLLKGRIRSPRVQR